MAVRYGSLPDWAKDAIRKAGTGMTQIVDGDITLSVIAGTARFNGQLVIGDEDPLPNEEQSINFSELPLWAKAAIRKAGMGTSQVMQRENSLHVNRGEAIYNGKKVIR